LFIQADLILGCFETDYLPVPFLALVHLLAAGYFTYLGSTESTDIPTFISRDGDLWED